MINTEIKTENNDTENIEDIDYKEEYNSVLIQFENSKKQIENLTFRADKLAKLYIELLNKYLQGE